MTTATSPWISEDTGKPTTKTYWEQTCDECGGFIGAGIAKRGQIVNERERENAAFHRLICPATSTGDESCTE